MLNKNYAIPIFPEISAISPSYPFPNIDLKQKSFLRIQKSPIWNPTSDFHFPFKDKKNPPCKIC